MDTEQCLGTEKMLTDYFRKKRGNEEGRRRKWGRKREAQGGVLAELRISEKGL